MQDIDPNQAKDSIFASGLLTYLGVGVISLWGGITSFLDSKEPFAWRRFIAHVSSSSFAGMMTGFACEYAHVPSALMCVFCGVTAHMGTPALIKLAMRSKIVRRLMDENIEPEAAK